MKEVSLCEKEAFLLADPCQAVTLAHLSKTLVISVV